VPVTTDLLTELTRVALADGAGVALREAMLAVEGADGASGLSRLLGAWAVAGARGYDEARAAAASLEPFGDPDLEAWRQALPVRVAVATDLERAEALLDELRQRFGPDSPVGRRRAEWLGHLRYRQGWYAEAAALHTAAARQEAGVVRRVNALVNAGLAWRDAYEPDRALDAFREARRAAEAGRLVLLEGHAVVGERSVLYRLDLLNASDLEVMDAIRALGQASLLAPCALNEAAVAWRAGHGTLAERLAREAARAWDHPNTRAGWILATALACAAGGHVEEAATLVPETTRCGPAALRGQALALLRLAGAAVPAVRGDASDPSFDRRNSVLSMREVALATAGEGGRGSLGCPEVR
jgi:hypothetical protein